MKKPSKGSLVSAFYRWHLLAFLSLALIVVAIPPWLIGPSNFHADFLSSWQIDAVIIWISMFAVAFHVGAFNLTMTAIRRGGVSVERNPFAKLFFKRYGMRGTLIVTSAIIVLFTDIGVLVDPTPPGVFYTGILVVGLNFFDWLNDHLAIWSQDYLLSSRTHGIPVKKILPHPSVDQLTEENIKKAWGAL